MTFHLAPFIAHWGVVAIALGAAVEGEAVVLTGGALAAAGLVSPMGAALAAFAGSAMADQLLFFVGRWSSHSCFIRRVRARPAFARALGWIERWPVAFVLAFRFVYGFRTVGPVAIGVSTVPVSRFVPLNLLSAAIWGATFTYLGYRFGPAIEHALRRVTASLDTPLLVLAIALVVAAALGLALLRRRAQSRQE